MRRDLLIIAILVIGVIAVAMVAVPLVFGPSSAEITSVSTDKDLYHSNEIMKIAISVNARGSSEDATIRLSGIRDRHGDLRLEKDLPVTLSMGPNTMIYDYQLPPCSSCAGLEPGIYQIEVELIRNGTVVSNTSRSIRIEQ